MNALVQPGVSRASDLSSSVPPASARTGGRRIAPSAPDDAVVAVFGLALLGLAFTLYHLFDFRIFWEAGRHLLNGDRIYPSGAALAQNTREYFVYPPLMAMLFAPFALLPYTIAAVVYAASCIIAMMLTLRTVGVTDRRCYVALLFWMPVLQGVGLGTIAPFLALALALVWKHRESVYVLPLVVALAVVAKLFLWPLFFWLLATKRWRATVTS